MQKTKKIDINILLIDDDEGLVFAFKKALEKQGYTVYTAYDYDEGVKLLDESEFELIFADILMGVKTGIDFLREVKNRKLSCPVVLITGYSDVDTATEAVRFGAYDYIPKPLKMETLIMITKKALKHKSLVDENLKYRLNLEAIFRSVKEAIITIDKNLNTIEINKAAEELFGVIGKNAKGKSFRVTCSDSIIGEAIVETLETAHSVERDRIEYKNKNTEKHIVSVTTYPLIGINEQPNGCVLVLKDETRLVDLEHNLQERQQYYKIIGKSEKMQKVYALINDLSDVETTVLINGESGTGKELVAEALHYQNKHSKKKPLVKVNCAALSDELLESELFGHVKGAFTGAISNREGRFQMADGGTIFLDEIGDISNKMQLRLLRVLQEKEFERVGESIPIKINVRVIAATNQNLLNKIEANTFREDLYHRLSVVKLNLPPLREKHEDIPILVNHFLKKFNTKFGKNIKAVSDDVQRLFMNYRWPGNVRELQNKLEHAFIVCRQSIITVDDMPFNFEDTNKFSTAIAKEIDLEAINNVLEKTAGNKSKAARLLGVSRWTFYNKLRKFNI